MMQRLEISRNAESPDPATPPAIRILAAASAAIAAYLAVLGALLAAGRVSFAAGAPLLGDIAIAGPIAFWIAAAVFAINAIGLVRRLWWARRLTIVLAAAGIFLAVPAISSAAAEAQPLRLARNGAGIIARVVVIWYCWQEHVADWFAAKCKMQN